MVSRDQLHQIFRYCLALTGDRQAAEDLLGAAVEKTLSRQDKVAKPCAHVRTTARELCRSSVRRTIAEMKCHPSPSAV